MVSCQTVLSLLSLSDLSFFLPVLSVSFLLGNNEADDSVSLMSFAKAFLLNYDGD